MAVNISLIPANSRIDNQIFNSQELKVMEAKSEIFYLTFPELN